VHLCDPFNMANAYRVYDIRGLLDGTPAEWLAMVQVNLLAPTLCSKLAISNMTKQSKEPRGHIINILSVWGCEVPRREYTHFYSATKHALKAVAEGLRIELATRKLPIKVTNVCPGPVETNFNVSSFGEEEAAKVFGGARDYERLSAEEVAEAVLGAVNVAPNVQVEEIVVTPSGYCKKN